MRALACIFGFLAGMVLVTAAYAGPARVPSQPFDSYFFQHDTPRLKMPGEFNYSGAPAERAPTLSAASAQFASQAAPSGLSFGPIHAEAETINGHRHVHYRMDGLTLFGGDIGGSIEHRGVMLTLHWRSLDN